MDLIHELWLGSGLANLTLPTFVMLSISCLLIYLAISKSFEPLILLPLGFGGLLANIPGSQIAKEGGLLFFIQEIGIDTGAFFTSCWLERLETTCSFIRLISVSSGGEHGSRALSVLPPRRPCRRRSLLRRG